MKFFRFCDKCGNRFQPETKFQKKCKHCYGEVRAVNLIKLISFNKGVKPEDLIFNGRK